MQVVLSIPYRTFKDKINITKRYDGKADIEIFDKYVYIESKEGAI